MFLAARKAIIREKEPLVIGGMAEFAIFYFILKQVSVYTSLAVLERAMQTRLASKSDIPLLQPTECWVQKRVPPHGPG